MNSENNQKTNVEQVEFIKKDESKQESFYQQFNVMGEGMPNPLPKDSDSKNIATLSHLSLLLCAPIVPIILYFVKKDDPFVLENVKEDINFFITCTIAAFISSILTIVLIGFLLMLCLMVFYVIGIIYMAIGSSEGKVKRMPCIIRLIK
jgi:uncharacterized protein